MEHSALNSLAARASDSASRARDAVCFRAEGYVRITGESVNTVGPGHLELHIPIMRYSLKACECISPQQGMISTVERGHLKGCLFGPIVLWRAEYHVKCNFPRTSRHPAGNDSSECHIALLD